MSDEEVKKPRAQRTLEKLKEYWSQLAVVGTILGSLYGGYKWVDGRLDEYAQRGVDIVSLKEFQLSQQQANTQFREEQAALNARITEALSKAFEDRDAADRARDIRITAVLNEMRARHGIIPVADTEELSTQARIRRAREEADRAEEDVGAAMPSGDPLEGL